MRRLAVLLVVIAAGCAANGPAPDVRVVGAAELRADDAQTGPPDSVVGDDGAPTSTEPVYEDEAATGIEDRPGSFGVIPMPRTVAVVGDSLTVAASEEITEALGRLGVRSVVVDGRESRRMATNGADLPSGVAAIEGILDEHDPDLWVVALGTNDVGAAVGSERFVADLRETVRAIPATHPVVWVDVWIRDRLADVVEANAMLRDEIDRRAAPSLVVDWFSNGQLDGIITADGIHLTGPGEVRFATVIADAVVTLATSG